eukprot:RCo041307
MVDFSSRWFCVSLCVLWSSSAFFTLFFFRIQRHLKWGGDGGDVPPSFTPLRSSSLCEAPALPRLFVSVPADFLSTVLQEQLRGMTCPSFFHRFSKLQKK